MSQRNDQRRVQDMLEAIERIERYAAEGRDAFVTNELLQTWVVHHLQIIGEAAARISDDQKVKHPEVPWKAITGMRNILVHDYFGIDLDIVWQAVENDIPALKRQVIVLVEVQPTDSSTT